LRFFAGWVRKLRVPYDVAGKAWRAESFDLIAAQMRDQGSGAKRATMPGATFRNDRGNHPAPASQGAGRAHGDPEVGPLPTAVMAQLRQSPHDGRMRVQPRGWSVCRAFPSGA